MLVRRLCIKPPSRPWYLTPLDRFERWLKVRYPAAHKIQRTVVDGEYFFCIFGDWTFRSKGLGMCSLALQIQRASRDFVL